MTLHNEQDAIQQAVDAGWKPHPVIRGAPIESIDPDYMHAEVLQDPAFWTALGKARGWASADCGYVWGNKTCSELKRCSGCGKGYGSPRPLEWKVFALRYFETRLSNGDTQAFWESLP